MNPNTVLEIVEAVGAVAEPTIKKACIHGAKLLLASILSCPVFRDSNPQTVKDVIHAGLDALSSTEKLIAAKASHDDQSPSSVHPEPFGHPGLDSKQPEAAPSEEVSK